MTLTRETYMITTIPMCNSYQNGCIDVNELSSIKDCLISFSTKMLRFYVLLFNFLVFESDTLKVRSRQITPLFGSFEKRIPKSLPVVTPFLVKSFVPYHMGPYGSQMIPLVREKLDDSGSKYLKYYD